MISVFEVLADPGRREILRLLLDGERSVGSLVTELPLAQPNVSKHLKVLRHGGLRRCSAERTGASLSPAARTAAATDAWLASFRATWNARLDALETHLDSMEG